MYIIHMKLKTTNGFNSYYNEHNNFSKALQLVEEMREQHKNDLIDSIDIIDSAKPLDHGCFKGFVIASLRTIK